MISQVLIPIYSVNFDYIVSSREQVKVLFAYTNFTPPKFVKPGIEAHLVSTKHDFTLPTLRIEDVDGMKIVLSFVSPMSDALIKQEMSKIGQDIQNFPLRHFYPYVRAGKEFHPYLHLPPKTSYGFSSRDDNFFKPERGWVFNEDPFGMSKPLMFLVV